MSEATKQKWARHEHGNHYVLQGDSPTPIGMFLKAEHAEQAVRAVNSYDDREALLRELVDVVAEVHRALTAPSRQLLDSTRREMQPCVPMCEAVLAKVKQVTEG